VCIWFYVEVFLLLFLSPRENVVWKQEWLGIGLLTKYLKIPFALRRFISEELPRGSLVLGNFLTKNSYLFWGDRELIFVTCWLCWHKVTSILWYCFSVVINLHCLVIYIRKTDQETTILSMEKSYIHCSALWGTYTVQGQGRPWQEATNKVSFSFRH